MSCWVADGRVVAVRGLCTKLPSVDDGIDEPHRVRPELTGGWDPPDPLEAELIPEAARGHVGLVDQIEYRVGITLSRRRCQLHDRLVQARHRERDRVNSPASAPTRGRLGPSAS